MRHDATPLTLDQARQLYKYNNFRGFLDSFYEVTKRLQEPADYELVTYDMIKKLASQGVRHAEVYISYGNILRHKAHVGVESITAAIERAHVKAEVQCGTTIFWIIDIVRHFDLDSVGLVLRKATEMRTRYPSIIGVGIGRDEALGPALKFAELFKEAKAFGFYIVVHAGEAELSYSIRDAIQVGAERIGHVLTAIDDPGLLELLAERQIPLELCVTSNLRTGCCKTIQEHPIRKYFNLGLMTTLNSDDPPMFGADLLDEYETVQKHFIFTNDEMCRMARNSILSSFLPTANRDRLLEELQAYSLGTAV